jgi:hypothetical protein
VLVAGDIVTQIGDRPVLGSNFLRVYDAVKAA